jgi:hypothetical protein
VPSSSHYLRQLRRWSALAWRAYAEYSPIERSLDARRTHIGYGLDKRRTVWPLRRSREPKPSGLGMVSFQMARLLFAATWGLSGPRPVLVRHSSSFCPAFVRYPVDRRPYRLNHSGDGNPAESRRPEHDFPNTKLNLRKCRWCIDHAWASHGSAKSGFIEYPGGAKYGEFNRYAPGPQES